jgi:hypothetical protein
MAFTVHNLRTERWQRVGPAVQASWVRTALAAGFRPLSQSDYATIVPFYSALNTPLADIDALMMIAWRLALNLHFLIEDEVLYMLASWNGKPVLWGPPIGRNVKLLHIARAFELLRTLDPSEPQPQIRYLWENHTLWLEIAGNNNFQIAPQSIEYLYDVLQLAMLSSPNYKKKRYYYKWFKENYDPLVVKYSDEISNGCLDLLKRWSLQKEPQLGQTNRQKFELERWTCESALREKLPMSGVAALINGKIQAFSIGISKKLSGIV